MQYAIERQLSIAIENQPGRRIMAAHGINIQDISVIDTVEQGVIRLVISLCVLRLWLEREACPNLRHNYR